MIRASTTRRGFLLLVPGTGVASRAVLAATGSPVTPPGRHRVRDYFNGRDLGEVSAPGAALPLAFDRFLLLETMPV